MNKYEGYDREDLEEILDDLYAERDDLAYEMDWEPDLDLGKEWREVIQEIDTVRKLLAESTDL